MTSPLSVVLEEKFQGEIVEDSADPTTTNKERKIVHSKLCVPARNNHFLFNLQHPSPQIQSLWKKYIPQLDVQPITDSFESKQEKECKRVLGE